MFEPEHVFWSSEAGTGAVCVSGGLGCSSPSSSPCASSECEGSAGAEAHNGSWRQWGGTGGSARAPRPGKQVTLINWLSKRLNKAWGWILTSQTRFLIKKNFPAFVSPLLLQSEGKSRLLCSHWLSKRKKMIFKNLPTKHELLVLPPPKRKKGGKKPPTRLKGFLK